MPSSAPVQFTACTRSASLTLTSGSRARARQVVDASVQLGRWMLEHTPREQADVPGLMHRVSALVTVPA